MKIGIPVNDKKDETTVCISFGRTPYFLIYDTETNERKYIDNSAAASQGGAGIKAAQILVDEKVEAVLTTRCGENAAQVLNPAGIKLYKTVNTLVEKTLEDFKEGRLNLLDEIHAGFHHHGH